MVSVPKAWKAGNKFRKILPKCFILNGRINDKFNIKCDEALEKLKIGRVSYLGIYTGKKGNLNLAGLSL
jgi:hypothetical protein